MGDLTEIKVGNILCFPFIYQTRHFITEVYQDGQAGVIVAFPAVLEYALWLVYSLII